MESPESYVIKSTDLTKKFGSFVANDKLTFEVKKGEIFGFLGANGAGKTTAIRIMCGLLEPTSGQLEVAGFDAFKQQEQIKRSIGYMSQKFSMYEDLTVEENIRLYAGIYGMTRSEIKERTSVLLEKLGMSSVRKNLIASIPLGWRQK